MGWTLEIVVLAYGIHSCEHELDHCSGVLVAKCHMQSSFAKPVNPKLNTLYPYIIENTLFELFLDMCMRQEHACATCVAICHVSAPMLAALYLRLCGSKVWGTASLTTAKSLDLKHLMA